MARAVGITERGGPEVLAVVDRDVREPGEGEVRVAVRAAAVNPTDVGLRELGTPDLPPPWVPGMDAAGTVESVGPGVRRLRVGDEVMAVVSPRRPEGGAQSELLVVPEASVVPIPEGASLPQAATLPMNGLTALLGLELLGLRPGDVLAVTGGAGLLASYVIPLAKRAELVVVADAKPEDEELVRGFGADHVVPRGDGFVQAVREHAPDGADGLYDTALLHERVFGAIRDGGGMVVVRGWRPERTERGITVHRVMVGEALTRTDWLERLRELASSGRLRLRVAGEYPPERAAEAHRLMEAGGLRGRAVITF
ncbi:NADPH:quinone reductase-like Zn-dependent oxidoreductase [Saccharothrix coeruleofusca]|uniref:quinone oxidoreductase family protein n=1 Tax=Saccharothrix coeruleofusca TaxID=33919 RepID=UPI001AE8D350|nr:NADP-dependent oxidoreductase [Saccharothrix coeruleofusca]MBP2335780.1 NADPH:quinone reductase-like Zn-dependent oxidoreductase [Saccharothrix coeruleofusca]